MRIRELDGDADLHEAAALFDRIWNTGHVLDPSTLRALAYTGNYVAGAYAGATLAGASVGFFAADGHLHSHITGIAPEHQGHGVGRALKQHQREWTLARGRTAISWTFDPLVARNAYFNLHTLGAVATEYLADFYGALDDGINAGDATDRLYVVWRLDGPDAPTPPPALAAADVPARLDRSGDEPVRSSGPSPGPSPVRCPAPTSGGGAPAFTVAVPSDIEKLRGADPALAIRWRMAVREALTEALAAGYRVAGITRDGRYLLEKP